MEQKSLFVLISHDMTPAQINDAKLSLRVDRIVTIPNNNWSQIPAEAKSVCPYTQEIKEWLKLNAKKGDYLLVQGDFGATVNMIYFARRLGLIPIYATTKRVIKEVIKGDEVITIRAFEHIRFREYEDICK